jgi:hypothetical protein
MPSTGNEPVIPAIERPQTFALDRKLWTSTRPMIVKAHESFQWFEVLEQVTTNFSDF